MFIMEKVSNEIIGLKLSLITLDIRIMKEFISDKDSIITFKDYIKYNKCTNKCYKYLLNLVVSSNDKILVKKDRVILSVLRNIVRNNSNIYLDKETSKIAFEVFKKYVFHKNADIRNCANRLLVGVELDDVSIKWLIENVGSSEHILNRLLRYPKNDAQIYEWAIGQYKDGCLTERISEVIGILIMTNIPEYIYSTNREVLWGVYYSRISDSEKRRLLYSLYKPDIMSDFIIICKRLGYYILIKEVLQVRKAYVINH